MNYKRFLEYSILNKVIIGVAVVAVITSGILYIKYQKAQDIIKSSAIAGQVEVQDLVKKVSRLILLPENEIPTVATVSDLNKLKNQPFFQNSHNGDKLLIFAKAKLAILYSPQADKIINVGPLDIGKAREQVAGASTVTPIRIALYNGTNVTGLTSKVEQQLRTKISNFVITSKENAKNTYTKTLIVDIAGNQQKVVSNLAKLINAEIVVLPDEEALPANSDILVILGK